MHRFANANLRVPPSQHKTAAMEGKTGVGCGCGSRLLRHAWVRVRKSPRGGAGAAKPGAPSRGRRGCGDAVPTVALAYVQPRALRAPLRGWARRAGGVAGGGPHRRPRWRGWGPPEATPSEGALKARRGAPSLRAAHMAAQGGEGGGKEATGGN